MSFLRSGFVWVWLVCLALTGAGQAAADPIGSAILYGKQYLRLTDWARFNNYSARWVKREETLELSNHSGKLVFYIDSREAELRGVSIRLSYPVVMAGGTPYISELDVRTALRPVLYPPHSHSGGKVQTIVLDPGHGGNDPGYQIGLRQEKKYTLLLAEELADQLRAAGFKVLLTRTSDSKVELEERPEIANKHRADLFISLHWNAGGPTTKGVQTYCLTPAGASSSNAGGQVSGGSARPGNANNDRNMFLAYTLQKAIVNHLDIDDMSVRRARFMVLCNAEMPAVLIEGGYLSHPVEGRRIADAGYRHRLAQAILEGVKAYKVQVEQVR